ncbi:hypothetical protein M3Y97_00942500 [Aphelenchoides bicaudatus]|nr:hypothetical protein M3Y97_00942500 [Aphelenchoides bicaudatus]
MFKFCFGSVGARSLHSCVLYGHLPGIKFRACKSNHGNHAHIEWPSTESFLLLPERLECLHKGATLFQWPGHAGSGESGEVYEEEDNKKPECPQNIEIESDTIVLENGKAILKRRECFRRDRTIKYKWRCLSNDQWRHSILMIGTRTSHNISRQRRWLPRRRLPKHSPIHFQQDKYVVELLEDVQPGTLVVKIHANHASNQPLYYSMSAPDDSRSANLFALDTVSVPYERLDPQISATATVIVDLLDVQDNSPQFERNAYFAEVKEDASVSYSLFLVLCVRDNVKQTQYCVYSQYLNLSWELKIRDVVLFHLRVGRIFPVARHHCPLNVFARDLDSGPNGEIKYSLQSQDDISHLFTIDPSSGVIQTKGKLDREVQNFVRMQAVATDKGNPPRNSTALIEITILDENDNVPQFTQPIYNVTIAENVTTPLVILKVEAKDADAGQNGEVHYSIVTSTSSLANLFSMDYDSGELTLRQPLDLKHSPYLLVIRAKDSGQPALSSTAHCYVHVMDINDHAPSFLHASPLHTISVEENVRVGFELGRLYAVDEDGGRNGEVRYKLEAENKTAPQTFEIDEMTGVIRTVSELDREQLDIYNFKVIASDLGTPPLSTELQLIIKVLDENDNVPKFEKDSYELQLSEDTPRGKQLLELKATDADLDQKIRQFFLFRNRSLHPLDEEIKLRVSATDQGGLQGFVNLTLKIVDENSAPVFVETPISVRAKDSDRGANSQLVYSIDPEDFGIDNSTGIIFVAKELDRERRSSYSVTVTVTDDGNPPLSSSTILEIVIADVNDNHPRFLIDAYRTSIAEDAAVGTSFLQVQAVDPDEGPNGIIDYFLNDTDPFIRMDYFRLDRTSGLLQINKPLDRETISSFDLQWKMSTASLFLQLNKSFLRLDNAPAFQQSAYDLWVAENSPSGTVVGTLIASDADAGPNQRIQFKIFGGPDARLFEIEADEEQNGVVRIKTRQEFDYEAKSNNLVYLKVFSGQLSSTVPITIHISDQNDNQPQLSDFIVLIAHFEDEAIDSNQVVGTIPAFDPDKNATLEYYLEPNELLEVESTTGSLKLKNAWHRQLNVESRACVSDGPNTRCASAQLIYVHVDNEALRQSVTLQLDSITRDIFMEPNFMHRFAVAIAELDGEWLPEDVRIFGVDEQRSDSKVQVNVSFFVVKEEQFVSPWRIEQADRLQIAGLEHQARVVRDDSCANEPCAYYQQCKRSLKFDKGGQIQMHETDSVLFRTMNTLRTFACECPHGFTTNPLLPGTCNQRLNLCFSHSCMNNSTCVPMENGYRCKCTNERTGPLCELSRRVDTCLPGFCHSNAECRLENRLQQCVNCQWRPQDTDEQCRLKICFIWRRLDELFELEFATVSQNALLLHSATHLHSSTNTPTDFFELSIRSGVPQLKASLGAPDQVIEMQLADWKENRVADGEWHKLKVEFRDWTFRLSLDKCDAELSLRHSHTLGYSQCAAEARFPLPSACTEDLSMPSCQRFLDLRPFVHLGGAPHLTSGLGGCVRNLKFNEQLIDFSNFNAMEKFGDVQPGCRRFRPDSCTQENHCPQGAKCIDQWEGHLCTCPHKLHSHKPCNLELPNGISLQDEESYAEWRLPSKPRHQQLHFEFRTRERRTQIMATEWKQKRRVFLFQLDGGKGAVKWGADSFFFAYGDLADGRWHSVTVDFEKGSVVIDHLYKKQLWQPSDDETNQKPYTLYAGNVPSSAYPHQFLGCLRNIHFGGISLKINDQSKTKPDCPIPNPCSSNSCPTNSQCVRDWDRHSCKCIQGHVGDQCKDACNVRGLCRNNGTCSRVVGKEHDYECTCPVNFYGFNCEHQKIEEKCPPGWFGQFESCQRCDCRTDRGFEAECDQKNGRCQCRAGMFLQNDRCVPCECGHGSASQSCDSLTGQCQCLGESEGRRCDQCQRTITGRVQLLERATLKCVDLRDRCPLSADGGINWPTTMRGAISRQSCPYGQMGVATRECNRQGQWMRVRAYNCTHPLLFELSKRTGIGGQMSDAPQLARQLLNLTRSDFYLIRARNLDLSIDALVQLVSNQQQVKKQHLKDSDFTHQIFSIFDQLFDQQIDEMQLHVLLGKLYEYGGLLAKVHTKVPYLRPFHFEGHSVDVSIERQESFQRKKRHSHTSTQLQPIKFGLQTKNTTIFKAFVKRNCRLTPCRNFGAEIYMLQAMINESLHHNHFGPIQIVFLLRGDSSDAQWSYPECLRASISKEDPLEVKRTDYFDGAPETTLEWTRNGGVLIGLNRTHATCQYNLNSEDSGSLFTLQIQPDSGALVQFALANHLPYTAPLSAAFALFLCLLALLATVFRSRVHMRSVRFAFILSFILNGTTMFLLQRVAFNSMFCSVRNALLSYLLSAQYIWILILALNTYRLLCDEKPQRRITLCFSAGLILPCLLCTLSFIFGSGCSLQLGAQNLWFVAGPSALILVLTFYVMATSLLLACNKKDKSGDRKAAGHLMLWLAIMAILCTAHSSICLYNLGQFSSYPMLIEAISNITLVFTSIYIFVWANFLSKEQSPNRKNEFWLNDEATKQKMTNEPDYQKPLLSGQLNIHQQIQPCTDWQPDLMMDTYIHHTLQRSLQPSQLASLPRTIGHYEETAYGQRYASALRDTPPSLRGSVGRSPKLPAYHHTLRIAQNPLSDLNDQAELSETYYEYRGRQRPSCTTFT